MGMVKGDDHTVDGNLCLDNTAEASEAASLMVIHILRQELDIHNKRTTITNNAATQADGGINMQVAKPYPRWPLPGIQTNNYADHNLKTLLVDRDNNDFRPKSSKYPAAGMIGKATANFLEEMLSCSVLVSGVIPTKFMFQPQMENYLKPQQRPWAKTPMEEWIMQS